MGKRPMLSARSRALLAATIAIATVGALQPALAAPPPPTSVDAAAANDGWINASEATGLIVNGEYPDPSTVAEIRVRVVFDGSCAPTLANSIGPFKIPTDGGTFGSGFFTSMPIDVSGLADGSTLCVAAHSRDGALTPSAWVADDNTAILDLTPPGLPTIVSPVHNGNAPSRFNIVGTTAEANTKVEVFDVTKPLEPVSVGTATSSANKNWSVHYVAFENGPRKFLARALDPAGNGTDSAILNVNVDAAHPVAVIEAPASGPGNIIIAGPAPLVEGYATDAGLGLLSLDVKVFGTAGNVVEERELKIANGGLTCTIGCPKVLRGTFSFRPNVGSGTFVVKIWGVDVAGNRSHQPAEISFIKLG